MTLREQLISQEKTRWLDVGCGGIAVEPYFEYVDILPRDKVDSSIRPHYHQLDIVHATKAALATLGAFDFIRSQHMLEHLTFEDGFRALQNVGALLNSHAIVVVTTPDLRIHIERYQKRDYAEWSSGWLDWAHSRLPKDTPASALFSMFAHSTVNEPHVWCYDAEGLIYQFERTGLFTHVRELKLDDPLAEEPFTHNRGNEDVCIIATRK